MLVFWLASDWPLGTLGAGYLASAHMAQFLLYTLAAAPLLLLGTPEWLAERVLGRLRLRGVAARIGSSLVLAGAIYNVTLIVTHSPGPGSPQLMKPPEGIDWSSRPAPCRA